MPTLVNVAARMALYVILVAALLGATAILNFATDNNNPFVAHTAQDDVFTTMFYSPDVQLDASQVHDLRGTGA